MTRSLIRYIHTFTGFGRDARLFLLTTVIFGAATSLYWIDFNLYLEAIGQSRMIGFLLATSQLAGVAVALPASALSDRIGRRAVMAGGLTLAGLALFLVIPGHVALLFVGVAALGAGTQAFNVVQVPYIAERTRPDQRNEYYAIWSAIGFLTGVIAAIVGGFAATQLVGVLHVTGNAAPYRMVLVGTAILGALALGSIFFLSSDRPSRGRTPEQRAHGRLGITIVNRGLFLRLLAPGFITALGAGQLIPFLNVFIKHKFGLDLESINVIFGLTSLGTAAAILAQPAIARRYGRIGSIVLVQGASIPFLLILGFSPVLWTVIMALAVRNSLMNAGSPIFDAFAMDRVSPLERATLSAGQTLLWALGWTIAPLYYQLLQNSLGFTLGYSVDFVTIIVLYTIATSLLWHWFHETEQRQAAADAIAGTELPAMAEANVFGAEGTLGRE